MYGLTKVLLGTIIVGVLVLQACISDNTDAYKLQKHEDPVISVQVKTGENTLLECSDGLDNDNDAGWKYIGGSRINEKYHEIIDETTGDERQILISYDLINPSDSIESDGIDCEDLECEAFYFCLRVENTVELCTDGIDNDLDADVDEDGIIINSGIDCNDSDCKTFPICLEGTEETCKDSAWVYYNNKNSDDSVAMFDVQNLPESFDESIYSTKKWLAFDNDQDGLPNCEDEDCNATAFCTGSTIVDDVKEFPGMLIIFRDSPPPEEFLDSTEYMMPDISRPAGIDNDDGYEGVNWRYNFNGTKGTSVEWEDLENTDWDESMVLKDQPIDAADAQQFFELLDEDDCKDTEENTSIDGGQCIKVSFPSAGAMSQIPIGPADVSFYRNENENVDNDSTADGYWFFDSTVTEDSTTYYRYDVNDNFEPIMTGYWGGFFLQFGDFIVDDYEPRMPGSIPKRKLDHLRDLSKWSHTKLQFEVKSDINITIKFQWGIEMAGHQEASFEDVSLKSLTRIMYDSTEVDEETGEPIAIDTVPQFKADGNWHSIEISFDGRINQEEFGEISNPFGLWADGTTGGPIFVDNIRFQGLSEAGCFEVERQGVSTMVCPDQ